MKCKCCISAKILLIMTILTILMCHEVYAYTPNLSGWSNQGYEDLGYIVVVGRLDSNSLGEYYTSTQPFTVRQDGQFSLRTSGQFKKATYFTYDGWDESLSAVQNVEEKVSCYCNAIRGDLSSEPTIPFYYSSDIIISEADGSVFYAGASPIIDIFIAGNAILTDDLENHTFKISLTNANKFKLMLNGTIIQAGPYSYVPDDSQNYMSIKNPWNNDSYDINAWNTVYAFALNENDTVVAMDKIEFTVLDKANDPKLYIKEPSQLTYDKNNIPNLIIENRYCKKVQVKLNDNDIAYFENNGTITTHTLDVSSMPYLSNATNTLEILGYDEDNNFLFGVSKDILINYKLTDNSSDMPDFGLIDNPPEPPENADMITKIKYVLESILYYMTMPLRLIGSVIGVLKGTLEYLLGLCDQFLLAIQPFYILLPKPITALLTAGLSLAIVLRIFGR